MMYVKREAAEYFKSLSENYNMIAVVGARQAGKTTFLKEQMKTFDSSYVLFDDPDARALFDEDVKKFEMQYIEGHELSVLDEVQYCQDSGSKLKYLVDSGRKLWITSSSEILMSKEILSFLVGRVSIVRLYPFSYKEFLSAKKQKTTTSAITKRLIWEHLTYGGYPRVVLTKDPNMKKIILRDLYETMILKDVARTFSITDMDALERLSKYLALNSANLISYDNIAKTLGMTFPTLKKYLNAMEKSYFIVRVKPFFTNKNKELTKQPKIYFLDCGLRNIITGDFPSEPKGKDYENYVFSELLKAGYTPKYWRSKTKAEVDFVLEMGPNIIPLEVKVSAGSYTVGRSLQSFISNYEPKKAFIVYYDGKKRKKKINRCEVTFVDMPGFKLAIDNLFRQKVDEGLSELDKGKGIPHEEIKKRIKKKRDKKV
jgi:predicted AAA+ superfamily ATPase